MTKRTDTKGKIVESAWKLFYEQGFDNTTVDEIIALSKTSKGSFYHYFDGKDALLGSLAYLFDEKYAKLEQELDMSLNSIGLLLMLNRELFTMIENGVDIDLLTRLYSTQLTAKGERELLDRNRLYYKLLRRIVIAGQERGEINPDKPASDIVKYYALCERALLYDWCLCCGDYSLKDYAATAMPVMLSGIAAK